MCPVREIDLSYGFLVKGKRADEMHRLQQFDAFYRGS
jgi:hypothetical protein